MTQVQITQAFVVNGQTFNTKQEAQDFIRLPQVKAALNRATGNNAELTDWLVAHQEQVEMAFEVGTVRRVTNSERAKLKKALEAVAEAGNPKFAFLTDNAGAVVDSFRWPSVKRMDDAEKATAARNSLVAASEGNEGLADWVIANKDAVLTAYEAGKVKREVSPKAASGLADYRAKMLAEKQAEEAAKAAGPEAHTAFLAERAKRRQAEAQAKADAEAAAKAAKAAT